MREKGQSYADIGRVFDLTRERVRQIIEKDRPDIYGREYIEKLFIEKGLKTCPQCKREYPATDDFFPRSKNCKYGLYHWCKKCNAEKNKIWAKANREKCVELTRNWRKANPEKVREHGRRWEAKNREWRNKYKRIYNQEPCHRLSDSISTGMNLSLRGGKGGRHWETLVGYTLGDLMSHLESQFTKGMAWDNYGAWHIDHIRPISHFDFVSVDDREFGECWSLWNLRPLWGKENQSRGNRVEQHPLPLL